MMNSMVEEKMGEITLTVDKQMLSLIGRRQLHERKKDSTILANKL